MEISLPNHYVDFYKMGEEIIASFPKGKKPSLLMHVCCGPCACFPFEYLCPHFDLTIYFNNSNIYPNEEYQKRLSELKRLISIYQEEKGYQINLVETPYDNLTYTKNVIEPYKDTKEGHERCWVCYHNRMEEAYDYAEEKGFDYFTTVMTISREKNSQILNHIGSLLEKKHSKTKYFYSDFKKKAGAEIGAKIRDKYQLYYQNYCGCIYSYNEMLLREKAKDKKLEIK